MLYGIETVKGARFRQGEARRRVALRAARQRRHPDADGVPESNLPRAARRVDLGATARLAAAASRRRTCRRSRRTSAASRPRRCARGSSSTARIPTCFACHGVMDPLGFALENFSAVGQFRTDDPDTLDARSTRPDELPDGTPIDGTRRTCAKPSSRDPDRFVQTLTENLMTFALGRSLDYRDMPSVRAIVRDAAADDYRFEVHRPRHRVERGISRARRARARADHPSVCAVSQAARSENSSHVSEQKTSIAAHDPQRRRRVDRTAAARRHDPGWHGSRPDAAAPKPRLGFVYFPHGALQDEWQPRQVGRNFDFPFIFEPLEPLRDYVTVVSGLRNKGGESSSPHGIIEETWLNCVNPQQPQCRDGRRRDGRPDRRTASRQGHDRCLRWSSAASRAA